jgi:hypothetical protein
MADQNGPVDPNQANSFANSLNQPAMSNYPMWLQNLLQGKAAKNPALQQAPQNVPPMVSNAQPNMEAQKAALQQLKNGGQ